MTLDSETQRQNLLDAIDGFIISDAELRPIRLAVQNAKIEPRWVPEHPEANH